MNTKIFNASAPSYRALGTLLVSLLMLSFNALAIDTPSDPRGTAISATSIKWEWNWVPGVVKYEVTVDGRYAGTTPNGHFTSTNLWKGDHSMRVRAIDGNGRYSAPTKTVKLILGDTPTVVAPAPAPNPVELIPNNGQFGTPGNPRGTQVGSKQVKWEWNAVANATKYEVTVDGIRVGNTSNTSYTSSNMWVGDHSMTVRAIDANNRYSSSTKTVKLVVKDSNDFKPVDPPPTSGITNPPLASPSNGKIAVPSNPRGSQIGKGQVKWEWDSVANAINYEVTVDGIRIGNTNNTSYTSSNLWVGDHSMTVKAIDSSNRFSEQSNTARFAVKAWTNSNPPPVVVTNPPANDSSLVDPASLSIAEATNKQGYELVFSDEFNGNALNPKRWNTQLRWDGEWNGERYEYRIINGESQFYVNTLGPDSDHRNFVAAQHNPFEFNGSRLAIRAVRNPLKQSGKGQSYGPLRSIVKQQPFLSGAIASYDKFKQKFGYFEARIKIPSHTGTFPAFWLHHQNKRSQGTRRSEIDIMENLGHAPWYIYNTAHYYTGVTEYWGGTDHFIKPSPDGQIYSGTDYSKDFHTYAVEWKPGHIIWYIDGQKVSEAWNNNMDTEELYIILNLAMGGNWTNYPTNSGGLGRAWDNRYPNQDDINQFQNPALEIDYVRAYRRK